MERRKPHRKRTREGFIEAFILREKIHKALEQLYGEGFDEFLRSIFPYLFAYYNKTFNKTTRNELKKLLAILEKEINNA